MTILPVAICNTEEPKVFNLSEVLDDKEVVLVGLSLLLVVPASPRQVSELSHLIFDLADGADRGGWLLLTGRL